MQDFSAILRKAGYKATPARIALLNLLNKSKAPLSMAAIMKDFGKKSVDQATLYRNLANLERAGLIKMVELRHGHAHYEIAGLHHHHHVVCTNCGRTSDITGIEIKEQYKKALAQARDFARITDHSLELFGLCKKCAKL